LSRSLQISSTMRTHERSQHTKGRRTRARTTCCTLRRRRRRTIICRRCLPSLVRPRPRARARGTAAVASALATAVAVLAVAAVAKGQNGAISAAASTQHTLSCMRPEGYRTSSPHSHCALTVLPCATTLFTAKGVPRKDAHALSAATDIDAGYENKQSNGCIC
jgi:hypothetical protein